MVFFMGCRGISAPVPGASSPPPSALTWMSARLFLLHFSHSSLTAAVQNFLLFLKYIAAEVPQPSLTGSSLASGGPLLEPAGPGSANMGVDSALFSQKPPLQPPPLQKTCYINPIQKYMSNISCLICFCFGGVEFLSEKIPTRDLKQKVAIS